MPTKYRVITEGPAGADVVTYTDYDRMMGDVRQSLRLYPDVTATIVVDEVSNNG